LVRQLEPHWPARLLLPHGRTIEGIATGCDVVDADGDNITAAACLSIARLNSARSRLRCCICSLVLIDQTWLGRRGGFARACPCSTGVGAAASRERVCNRLP
jgi:hypothetical protein